jgi:hypothetical protein
MINKMDTKLVGSGFGYGVGIDSKLKLKIQKFEFSDSYDVFKLDTSVWKGVSVSVLLSSVSSFLIALDSSTTKGFLPHLDLTKFPVISELLPCFWEKDESYVNGVESMESYKWLYNVVILNLYTLIIETSQSPCIDDDDDDDDVVAELKNCESDLFDRLDPSIRLYLVKRGVSIKENVYVGFDTEYTKFDYVTNRIVSSQLAVSSKCYLQLPRMENYKLSKVDEKSNKVTLITKSSNCFKYSKVEGSIQSCITLVRNLKYGFYDVNVMILGECLRLLKGVNYTEHDDSTLFSFPRSSIQPFIKLGNNFSFQELIDISCAIALPQLQTQDEMLKSLLTAIAGKGFSMVNGRDKLLGDIYSSFNDYVDYEVMSGVCEKVLPYLTSSTLDELSQNKQCKKGKKGKKVKKMKNEKSLSRSYLYLPERVSVTKKRVYTVIGHLTPADLSVLSDFELLKEELSIVNGSFVTLGKPIKWGERCVHVRDTMLLAPGLSKSLDSIGKMYGAELNKIKISQSDIENMHDYLERDKDGFIAYAIRDAVISLVHAS